MRQAIGDVIPYAVGVAISPLPILALILMLLTPKARRVAPAFASGWIVGLAVVGTIGLVVGASLAPSGGGSSGSLETLKIVLGAALILMGLRRWRARPGPGDEPRHPKWMATIESTGPGRGLLLGAALAAVNPKNLILGLAAGAAIAQTAISGTKQAIALAVYVVLGALTILVPLVLYLAGGDGARRVVQGWRTWLATHSSVVMAVVLVVLGAVVLGKGIAAQ